MRKYFAIAATAAMLLFLSSFAIHAGLPQTPVFDGTSLAGWHALGGADWRVDNGDLVGTVRNGAGGWLVLDSVYGPSTLTIGFECKNCEPSLMIRSGKVGDRTSGVEIALSGAEVGSMFRITLDSQGKMLDRKPMPSFGGAFAAKRGSGLPHQGRLRAGSLRRHQGRARWRERQPWLTGRPSGEARP